MSELFDEQDWFDEIEEPEYNRDTFQWKDKEGHKLFLDDIGDDYLQNIISFLKHKEEPKYELIAFLEKEQ